MKHYLPSDEPEKKRIEDSQKEYQRNTIKYMHIHTYVDDVHMPRTYTHIEL